MLSGVPLGDHITPENWQHHCHHFDLAGHDLRSEAQPDAPTIVRRCRCGRQCGCRRWGPCQTKTAHRRPGDGRIRSAGTTDALLMGWIEISAYMRRSIDTVRRYARLGGLPVTRFGYNVVISRQLIDTWLLTRHEMGEKSLHLGAAVDPAKVAQRMQRALADQPWAEPDSAIWLALGKAAITAVVAEQRDRPPNPFRRWVRRAVPAAPQS